jgi:hypothetical protein
LAEAKVRQRIAWTWYIRMTAGVTVADVPSSAATQPATYSSRITG